MNPSPRTQTHPAPNYRVTVAGQNITPLLDARLISLSLTECRAGEADQLDITLSDADGKLDLPAKGALITLALGWHGQTLVDKGSFTVDETEHQGAPDQVHLRARSAALNQALRIRAEKSWHSTTLGHIASSIAKAHSLSLSIDPELAATPIAHVDQTGESDINFLTRLANQYDTVATVKAGSLILKRIDGTRLGAITITRASGDQHRWHTSDRDAYSGVTAQWYDPKTAKRHRVLAGSANNLKAVAPSRGTVAKADYHGTKQLKDTYANEHDALAAAKAEWARIQRGMATLELTLALGDATLRPQTPVTVRGFKPQIDNDTWLVVKSTHTLGDGGFVTRVEMELGA
jgi:uncharacterized protein